MEVKSIVLPEKEDTLLKITAVDHSLTPKTQKQNIPIVKRWASVVKAQKKVHPSESDEQREQKVVSEALYKTFPKNIENHKAFISGTERMLSCDVCSVELDSLLSLTNHIKTRKHEDNVIHYLKGKLPANMHHSMEFVSFCGTNLCCNLCRCKIVMSSNNPYETIINIISHNSEEVHSSQKTNQEAFNQAYTLLRSFASADSMIKNNFHLIEARVSPQYKCGLCNKNILYHENPENMKQNFILHLKSNNHIKNQNTVNVLELFEEARHSEKNVYVLINGNISCTYCDEVIETDLDSLITHENSSEHARKILSKLEIGAKQENKQRITENKTNQKRMFTFCNSNIYETAKKDNVKVPSKPNNQSSSKIATLLSTIPFGMKYKDCIIENDKGSVTCLICERIVPPNTYNIQTHLFGNNHKKNEELKMSANPEQSGKKQLSQETIEKKLAEVRNNVNNIQAPRELSKVKNSNTNKECPEVTMVSNVVCSKSQSDLKMLKPSSDFQEGQEVLCPTETLHNCELLKNIPAFLLSSKSHKMEKISSPFVDINFDLLVKKNCLVEENKGFLVRNVDGRNSYCSLCKTLIPISLNLNDLEVNIVSHLVTKNHKMNVTDQLKNGLAKYDEDEASKGGKVARSLFKFSSEQGTCTGTKSNEMQNPFSLNEMQSPISLLTLQFYSFHSASKDSSKLLPIESAKSSSVEKEVTLDAENTLGPTFPPSHLAKDKVSTQKEVTLSAEKALGPTFPPSHLAKEVSFQKVSSTSQPSDKVFVFGKDGKTIKPQITASRKTARLPVAVVPQPAGSEVETDMQVLRRRQKQIDYGKNTEGYVRFCRMVQRCKRGVYDPQTPPRELKCSRRMWDGMVRVWRRHLHSWDPPSTVQSDIKPLA